MQRVGYALIGPAQRLFEHIDSKPGQYSESTSRRICSTTGKYPETAEYKALFDNNFADYRLRIGGLVDNPFELHMTQLPEMPEHQQITQHFCIQGWSGSAK